MISVKDRVKDGKTVRFSYYRDGALWYLTEDEFLFPVPLSDIGTATFMAEDKAMLFMRWIRKHMATLDESKSAQDI